MKISTWYGGWRALVLALVWTGRQCVTGAGYRVRGYRCARAALGVILLQFGVAALAQQAQVTQVDKHDERSPDFSALHIVGNTEIAAVLTVGKLLERITGRVSIALRSGSRAGRYTIDVQGFNVIFTGVSQSTLGEREDTKNPLGLLGLALQSGKPQTLRVDPRTGHATGELQLRADASWLQRFAAPAGGENNDLFLTPTIPVTATVELDLGKAGRENTPGPSASSGSLTLKLAARELRLEGGKTMVPAFKVEVLKPPIFDWHLASVYAFEVERNLCVQPIRLEIFSRWDFAFQQSGLGLDFGLPGVRQQWDKADISFEIRNWKKLFTLSEWELSKSEEPDLLARVEDDDCIEVFFVNSFDPDGEHGGGATWGGGTAASQIISSDDNARNNIDFTHLAHEFGHVLGLRHPDQLATASAVPATTGTLMCGSGFRNDNPRVNSQENATLLQNPLLTFSLKVISAGPDCTNDASCGACR